MFFCQEKIWLALGAFAVTWSLFPGVIALGEENNEVESASRLKYFGYFHVDGFPFGAPDHFDQLFSLNNTNVLIIHDAYTREKLEQILARCRKHDIKVLLMVHDRFFTYSYMRKEPIRMQEDWEQRWESLKVTIAGLEDDILGFYFDEPYWLGVQESDFHIATKKIREDYPQKHLIAGLMITDLDTTIYNPYGIDEVSTTYYKYVTGGAFYYYVPWQDSNYPDLLERLKTKLVDNQDIWFIPWAFTNETPESAPEVLEEHLAKLTELARNEPRCVGLLCFSFASGDDYDFGSGCHRLFDPEHPLYSASLKELHSRTGREIIAAATE